MIGLSNILTNHGYKLIDTVTLDDKLMNHKGTFQEIHEIQKKMYAGELYTFKLKYHPNVVECTKDHPFYVLEQGSDKPIWKEAYDLCLSDLIGMVINKNEIATLKIDWYALGYYISNGNEFSDQTLFAKLLRNDIPEWLHDEPISNLKELIKGFEYNQNQIKYNIAMALAIQRIYLKIGRLANVIKVDDLYTIESNKKLTLLGLIYAWYPVVSITNQKTEKMMYQFKIDDSYIVENLIM